MLNKKNKFLAVFLSAILFVGTAFVGVSAAPKKVKITKIKVGQMGKSVKVTFKKIKGAKGYQIRYGYKKNLKGAKIKFVKKRTVTLKKLTQGKTLYVKVRAKLKKGYSKYSAVKKVKLVLNKKPNVTTTTTTQALTTPVSTVKDYSTVGTTIPRVQVDGNPTDSFIASCQGFTLKYLYPWEGPVVDSPVYESNALVEQLVEDEFGCTIEETGFYTGYMAAMTASLAAGAPQAHIYRLQDINFVNFLNKGYFCDLTDGMKKSGVDFKDPWYDLECREFFNINGKQVAWSGSIGDPYKLYYNKAWVERTQRQDPIELVKQGKWTWDEFLDYTSGGCVVLENDFSAFAKGMVASYGKSTTKLVKGSAPTTNIEDETVKYCLNTLEQWRENGKVGYRGGDWTAAAKSFGKGDAAMIYGDSSVLSYIEPKKFNSEIGVVPFPKPTESQTKYYSVVKNQFPYFIPYTYKTEAAKILFLNNERNRQAQRFWNRDFCLNYKDVLKGEELNMALEISHNIGNFASTNDWTTYCETADSSIGITTFRKLVDAFCGGQVSAEQSIDIYSSELAETYETVWSGNTITGNF